MQVTCSNCQSKIRVPDSAAGKKGKCPKCGNIIAIPVLDAPEEVAPEPVAEAPPTSSFDFEAGPAPAAKGSRDTDDALESGPPPRKSKVRAADDEEDYDDDDEDARRRKKIKKKSSQESVGLSVTSLSLGGASFIFGAGSCCCPILTASLAFILGVTAIVLGIIGMKKGGKVMAIIGMSLGGVGILLALLWIILTVVFAVGGGMGNNMNFKF
jgi:predicted Zn finger-like uncharacterized protein